MNLAGTRAAEGFARRSFTAHDVRRMVENGIRDAKERTELVEGEFVILEPKVYDHDLIKNYLNVVIIRSASTDLMVGVAVSVQFTDRTILEPDLIVFDKQTLVRSDADFCHFERYNPLLVIEISVSSLRYDSGLKAGLYARYGVPELWVVDASERIAWVHLGPKG
ncbi:MAG: Uma2 family endonuclease [Xanthobacteraceae bacterium]|nr:Uma2 family endonuclease [Xanthobacteraceae bacterium]